MFILPGLILQNSMEKISGKPVVLPLLGIWQYLFTNLFVGQGLPTQPNELKDMHAVEELTIHLVYRHKLILKFRRI